jgi:selenocysteine lyase/cysteine desulfurase
MLERCRVALSERTRLVAMSHITTETGDRLPVAEIARLAHQAGALVLYDGAQACGQLPVDLRAIDCDFYIVVGYKWLFGPFPSALVYLHRRVLERVEVTWTGSHAAVRAGIDMDELEFAPSARRFEFGGRPWASESAMAVGVDYVGRLGLAAIERHGQQLAVGLHQRLDDLPGAQIWSPREPALLNGIVTFSLAGLAGPTIVTALRERWGILTRPALQGRCVRAAMAAFTSEEDLDRLSRALATLVAEQRVGG